MGEALFSAAEFQDATCGKWLTTPPAGKYGISTDTRISGRGKLFFAISGETFDAHDFLDQAIVSGCEGLCIRKNFPVARIPGGIPVLQVEDTLKALQDMAACHRLKFSELKVAAVTGSVGKTSVKEMLRAIFSAASAPEHVLYTDGNTNNHIGVPKNLLRLSPEHRYAVLEAGTSSHGEIAPLAQMIRPDAAVVNSIAPCHLENLGDLNGVAREKSAIFSALAPDGIAVIPAESPANEILRQAGNSHRCITFGRNGNGDVTTFFREGSLSESKFTIRFPDNICVDVAWQLAGEHQVLNAAAAAAIAAALGITPETIAEGLSKTTLPGMRMKSVTINGVNYINDAYNANPASMRAMIMLLKNSPPAKRLILLLGGMRELGENSHCEHVKILDLAKSILPGAEIITIGREFSSLHPSHFDKSEDAAPVLASLVREGDTVVVKGSRGNRVELALPPEAR